MQVSHTDASVCNTLASFIHFLKRVTESRHHPNVRMHSDKIHNIVKLDIYNTHHIELQPRPRDCNESIIINQVLVLTLARTRHIPDIRHTNDIQYSPY